MRDKVALVTGAGAGIGHAIALRLAGEGAAVVVADVDERGGEETVRRIEAGGGRAAFVLADVADEADVRAMVAAAEQRFGGLDVLVNNAGGAPEPYFPEADPEHWGRTLDVNLRGVMLGIHFAVRAMRGRGGAIVNISSMAGVGYEPYEAPEIADAVVMFIRDETLAGRVMVWPDGEPRRLVPVGARHRSCQVDRPEIAKSVVSPPVLPPESRAPGPPRLLYWLV